MKNILLPALFLCITGCPSIHTLRTAEVLKPGQSEVVGHVGSNGFVVSADASVAGESAEASGGLLLPFAVVSYRTGIADRMDMQIKVDLGILPELSLGYQFVGTPGEGGLAVSGTVGMKYLQTVALAGDSSGSSSVVYLPLTLMADLPIDGHKIILRGGSMVLKFGDNVFIKPMLGVAAQVRLGKIKLLPELNYMHGTSLNESDDAGNSASFSAGQLAIGLGFVF
jgi:hypothetical protein